MANERSSSVWDALVDSPEEAENLRVRGQGIAARGRCGRARHRVVPARRQPGGMARPGERRGPALQSRRERIEAAAGIGDERLRVFAGDVLVAEHRLRQTKGESVVVKDHHRILWEQALPVARRELADYEEAATWN